jgi:uncharacterized protein
MIYINNVSDKINQGEGDMMSIFKKAIPVIVLCFVMGFISIANAAESGAPAEKRQVFERFLVVTDMQARQVQITDMMVNQIIAAMKVNIQQMIQKKENVSPEQKKKFEQILNDAMGRLASKMIAAMKQEMPFSDLVDRVYYPLYDKYFSTSDLEAVINFYESPAGKKFASTAPLLLQESMALFNGLYSEKLQKISQTIAEEELKRIKPELEKIDKEGTINETSPLKPEPEKSDKEGTINGTSVLAQ